MYSFSWVSRAKAEAPAELELEDSVPKEPPAADF